MNIEWRVWSNGQRGPSKPSWPGSRSVTYLSGGALGNFVSITPAVHAVFGTFLIPVTQEFGWARATFSFVLMIIAAAAAIIYPVSGYFADRFGGRPVLTTGFIMFAASLAGLAFLNGSVPLLYSCFLIVGICGAVPSTALLSKLVSERFQGRATALALTAGVGNSVGCMVMPIVAAAVLSTYGWRDAYLVIGIIVLVCGLTSVLMLGGEAGEAHRPAETVVSEGIAPVLASPIFWLLLVTVGFGAGSTAVIFSHIVPILAEHGVGLSEATAAVSLFALVSMIVQVASGRLLDSTSSPRIAVGFYIAGALGLGLVEFGRGSTTIFLGVTLLGLVSGMQWAALPYVIGRYFGFRHFGLLVSLMYSAVVTAQGVVPVLLDATFDATGSYRNAVLVGCAAYIICAASLALLPSYSRSVARQPVAAE